MKESNSEKLLIFPEQSKGEKKYIYGTYIEMAFHNMFTTMDHIYLMVFKQSLMQVFTKKMGKDEAKKDFGNENYLKIFREDCLNAKPEEKVKIKEMLCKHFPFVVIYTKSKSESSPNLNTASDDIDELAICLSADACIEQFCNLFVFMREVRHYYAHYWLKPYDNEIEILNENIKGIIRALKNTYDASRRIAKSRFDFTDNQMKMSDRFSVKNIKGKKSVKENKAFKYKIDDEDGNFTEFGLVFLAAMFLEKRYIKIFVDKNRLFGKYDAEVMFEILSIYRIRLAENKLNCKTDITALGLDMLNELRRCPAELYDLLGAEDKKKFRIYDEKTDNNNELDSVLMLRHGDRFSQLALRYIDEKGLFSKIRFHVFLGRYFHTFYDKKCIDSNSEDRVRCLHKDLKGFGRLNEIEDRRKEDWKELIREYDDVHPNTSEEKPYITDCAAQYMITGNRIGMWIADNGSKLFMPQINEGGAKGLSPDCWLSVNELPALIFYILLCNHNGEKAENIILNCVQSYRKLFEDIWKGKLIPMASEQELGDFLQNNYGGIRLVDIPKKLQSYLLGKSSDVDELFNSWAETFVKKLKKQTDNMISRFEADLKQEADIKQNKIGKKRYVEIKDGKLADFLAEDIMRFLPADKNNKNKLTSLNYRVFQAALATFDRKEKWDDICRIFKSANIIGNEDEAMNHPFVGEMIDCCSYSNIRVFYQDYLRKRREYLDKCLKKCIKRNSFRSLHFLHADRLKWAKRDKSYYSKLAKRYLGTDDCMRGIELPCGLFSDVIRKELISLGNEKLKLKAEDVNNNIYYLISAYMTLMQNEESQPMYDYQREYKIFQKLGMSPVSSRDGYKQLKITLSEGIDKYLHTVRLSKDDKGMSLDEKRE